MRKVDFAPAPTVPRHYCKVMFAAWITLAHFSISATMNLSKIVRRHRRRRAAEIGKARLDIGVGESGVNFLVEHSDDSGGRISGRADTLPRARFKPRTKFWMPWSARGWPIRGRCGAVVTARARPADRIRSFIDILIANRAEIQRTSARSAHCAAAREAAVMLSQAEANMTVHAVSDMVAQAIHAARPRRRCRRAGDALLARSRASPRWQCLS